MNPRCVLSIFVMELANESQRLLQQNDIRYEDIAVPEIGDGDMLIKMHSCGLCGTDIHKAQHQTVTGPVILGHEVSGEVVKVGKT
ncbi:hypothetical protein DMH27_13195 [Raoultella planticola]|uniref:Alcohol dehydrogenase-like N-terminal domain-containing protein n=1 Tax=Raoultella planticola TaxID=575 RepID=A0A5P6AAR5_RAOPL|nr:hypothetical protein [Raoultella planticola]QFG77048.1 hypothetical protein DMB90_24610 [Raoultella planticola]